MGYMTRTLQRVSAVLEYVFDNGIDTDEYGRQRVPLVEIVAELVRRDGMTVRQVRAAADIAQAMGCVEIGRSPDRLGDQRLKYATLTDTGRATVLAGRTGAAA